MDDSIPLEAIPKNAPSTMKFRYRKSQSFKNSLKSLKSTYKLNLTESFRLLYEESEFSQLSTESDKILEEKKIIHQSEIIRKEYEDLFLIEKNSNKLLRNFFCERCELQYSDAKGFDFSIKSVLLRMKSGYQVYKYNYSLKHRKISMIIIDESMVKLKTASKCSKQISFDCIHGVVIGCETMTFKLHKSKINKAYGQIHNDSNCFSIITSIRSYDFACVSDLARYDICIATS